MSLLMELIVGVFVLGVLALVALHALRAEPVCVPFRPLPRPRHRQAGLGQPAPRLTFLPRVRSEPPLRARDALAVYPGAIEPVPVTLWLTLAGCPLYEIVPVPETVASRERVA